VEELLFSVLNVCSVTDNRQTEALTIEPLVPGSSRLEVEIAIAKLKEYKSPGSVQIPAELIQAGRETLLSARKRENFQRVAKRRRRIRKVIFVKNISGIGYSTALLSHSEPAVLSHP
jgi:hypothetical protein